MRCIHRGALKQLRHASEADSAGAVGRTAGSDESFERRPAHASAAEKLRRPEPERGVGGDFVDGVSDAEHRLRRCSREHAAVHAMHRSAHRCGNEAELAPRLLQGALTPFPHWPPVRQRRLPIAGVLASRAAIVDDAGLDAVRNRHVVAVENEGAAKPHQDGQHLPVRKLPRRLLLAGERDTAFQHAGQPRIEFLGCLRRARRG
mmetsp:Transcript_3655/g.11496  ORF Transcript_3655/g.11496 Transcript_3655/m.11496 type:complete len:204 (-) Transcript_3655:377-988(-)